MLDRIIGLLGGNDKGKQGKQFGLGGIGSFGGKKGKKFGPEKIIFKLIGGFIKGRR